MDTSTDHMQELRVALGLAERGPVGSTVSVAPNVLEAPLPVADAPRRSTKALLSVRAEHVYRFCNTPAAMGFLTFLVMLIVLLITKPVFCGSDVVNDRGENSRKVNTKAVLITAGVAGGLMAVVPYIVRWKFSTNIEQDTQM